MRKPYFANDNAPLLEVTVFAKGSKKAALRATGKDPADIARTISAHNIITALEREYIRPKLFGALQALSSHKIDNMTDCQLDIAGRRIRCKIVA